MKIAFIITLLSWGVISYPPTQYPRTNAPEIINPLLDRFISEAESRGVEVSGVILALDSISIIKQPLYKGEESEGVYWFAGSIDLKASIMRDTETAAPERLLFHELGHAFGLDDCNMCIYNIMRARTSPRANYLFRDERLADIYLDVFFEAIENPDDYNKNHKHR